MKNMNALKHGQSYTKLYKIWAGMKSRCSNPNDMHFKYYGCIGIKVCEEWQRFEPFYDWAVANGYKEGMTIDRIKNTRNYEPSNCRWVDMKTQGNNKSNNRLITFNGETKNLSQWADECGINRTTLTMRLSRGWSIENALKKERK